MVDQLFKRAEHIGLCGRKPQSNHMSHNCYKIISLYWKHCRFTILARNLLLHPSENRKTCSFPITDDIFQGFLLNYRGLSQEWFWNLWTANYIRKAHDWLSAATPAKGTTPRLSAASCFSGKSLTVLSDTKIAPAVCRLWKRNSCKAQPNWLHNQGMHLCAGSELRYLE